MSVPKKVVLHSYWRSSCSWRVRIALNLKGIDYEYKTVNLLQNEQFGDEYTSKLIPLLEIDDNKLQQSMAIIEYLEETRVGGAQLLPSDAVQRAKCRQLANMIACDIQPVQNLRILRKVGPENKKEWGNHWITVGFEALERALADTAGKYCFGDYVSIADICLVPQVYNARRFGVDMSKFPTIERIEAALSKLPAFERAHPSQQPDAVAQ
ncbi:MAG: hypothetical protein MHM6MM_004338 [Cercozoa sp. M6MM]